VKRGKKGKPGADWGGSRRKGTRGKSGQNGRFLCASPNAVRSETTYKKGGEGFEGIEDLDKKRRENVKQCLFQLVEGGRRRRRKVGEGRDVAKRKRGAELGTGEKSPLWVVTGASFTYKTLRCKLCRMMGEGSPAEKGEMYYDDITVKSGDGPKVRGISPMIRRTLFFLGKGFHQGGWGGEVKCFWGGVKLQGSN